VKNVLCGLFLLASLSAWANQDIDLNKGWLFHKTDALGGQEEPVTLPHTWNVGDGADGGTYYRGPAWYRRDLNLKFDPAKEDVYLRFGAASLAAKVYVNDKLVGEHKGGFAAFCFDATRFVKPGQKHTLSVRVDNSRNADIAPLSGDFTVYGGLYRGVTALVRNKVCISPIDDAGPGVYITPTINDGNGTVRMRVKVRNTGSTPQNAELTNVIFDAKGKPLATISTSGPVSPGDSEMNPSIVLPKVHLWDGVHDPYLYRCVTTIKVGGRVVDSVTQSFGFRSFRVDAEKGFFLNNKPYDYHGVNLHQGSPALGWASTQAQREQDFKLVKEIGATGVRLAHYQHPPESYELCDKYGFVCWAEIPFVNEMTNSAEFKANCSQQLRELIKQNYNHPSICLWSIYNEPRVNNKKPDTDWLWAKDLIDQGHQMDPIRIMTGAASERPEWWLMWIQDQTAFNRYYGWYGDKPETWGPQIDKMKQRAQGKAFGMSEYGAGASIFQHEVPGKQPDAGGKWHPEEYQSVFHEEAWKAMQDRPWVWCKLIWVMFDFPSDGRDEGDHPGINDKGMVTADRKTKKDTFYYYQSQWTTAPMVHICSSRFNPRPAGETMIKVYSNAGPVELLLNGKSLGVQKGDRGVYEFPCTLAAGQNVVTAKAKGTQDKVTWTAK